MEARAADVLKATDDVERQVEAHQRLLLAEVVPYIPFPSYKLWALDRPGALQGARSARRSEPLTARTDLESSPERERGSRLIPARRPTLNPEEPTCLPQPFGLGFVAVSRHTG